MHENDTPIQHPSSIVADRAIAAIEPHLEKPSITPEQSRALFAALVGITHKARIAKGIAITFKCLDDGAMDVHWTARPRHMTARILRNYREARSAFLGKLANASGQSVGVVEIDDFNDAATAIEVVPPVKPASTPEQVSAAIAAQYGHPHYPGYRYDR